MRFDVVREQIKVPSVDSKTAGQRRWIRQNQKFRLSDLARGEKGRPRSRAPRGPALLFWTCAGIPAAFSSNPSRSQISSSIEERSLPHWGGRGREPRTASAKNDHHPRPAGGFWSTSIQHPQSEIVAGALKKSRPRSGHRCQDLWQRIGANPLRHQWTNRNSSSPSTSTSHRVTCRFRVWASHRISSCTACTSPDQNADPSDWVRLLTSSHKFGEKDPQVVAELQVRARRRQVVQHSYRLSTRRGQKSVRG